MTTEASNGTPGHVSQRNEDLCPYQSLHMSGNSSSIHSSPKQHGYPLVGERLGCGTSTPQNSPQQEKEKNHWHTQQSG